MNVLFWGLTLGVAGKILVALAILKVHHVMAIEHRIDEKVIRSFSFEKAITVMGVVLILLGYFLELYFYGIATTLLSCHGGECEQAASVFLSQ